jgi:hypothetical protein
MVHQHFGNLQALYNKKATAISVGEQSRKINVHRHIYFVLSHKKIYACGNNNTKYTSSQSNIQIDHNGKHSGCEDLIFFFP